jgi:hypothetical protein
VKIDHNVITGWFRCAECAREFDSPTRRGTIWMGGDVVALADVYQHECGDYGVLHAAVLAPFPDAHAALLRTIFEACPPLELGEAA